MTLTLDLLSGRIQQWPEAAPGNPCPFDELPASQAFDKACGLGLGVSGPAMFLAPSRIVTYALNRGLVIIDVTTGAEVGRLRGHTQPVTALAALPGNERLITGSEDRTIRLWDLGTMEEVADLRGHLDTVTGLAVTPDGATIYSCSNDYTLRRADTRPEAELYAIREEYDRVAQQLTQRIEAMLVTDANPESVADTLEGDPSLTVRERQIGLQCLIRRLLSIER